jgi:hypothetical protein
LGSLMFLIISSRGCHWPSSIWLTTSSISCNWGPAFVEDVGFDFLRIKGL